MTAQPTAFVLFGGTCSGKTEVANRLEAEHDYVVVSKDRLIYESDMLHRDQGISVDWEALRANLVTNLRGQNVAIDETVRIGRLAPFAQQGYQLIGLLLPRDSQLRADRLQSRIVHQRSILRGLSEVTRLNLDQIEREDRRTLWRSRSQYEGFGASDRRRLDDLLYQIYHTGSHFMKHEDPNPACFNELDGVYIVPPDESFDWLDPPLIQATFQPWRAYQENSLKVITHCVWDIGNVIYEYSLDPLMNWGAQQSATQGIASPTQGRFSFNEYMLGRQSFAEMCASFCASFGISFSSEACETIRRLMWDGIGATSGYVAEAMEILARRGITNCVLSNALPELEVAVDLGPYVRPEHMFYSFRIGALKPDSAAYLAVRDSLGIDFHQMAFVDDKRRNVDAATELGILSLVYDCAVDAELPRDLLRLGAG